MAAFLLRAGADTERGDNRFAGELRKEHMHCVGDDRMRDAGFGAFTLSTLELAEVFALNGDFGAADSGCSVRSEEHTSEIQSLMRISFDVFFLKKKTQFMSKHLWKEIVEQ